MSNIPLRPPQPETRSQMNDRIPAELRSRRNTSTANGQRPKRQNAASGARILTAGFSVAVGIGLVGAMAASTAAANQAVIPPAHSPVQRVIIIEQPAPQPAVSTAPGTTVATTSPSPVVTEPPQPLPTVRIVQTQPAPAPEPVTVSEGS
jgi:hypothetical protein